MNTAYPRDGYGAIATRMAASLRADRLRTGHEVTGLECEAGCIRMIRRRRARVGLLERTTVREWRHHALPNAYPVYALGYEAWLRRILDGLSGLQNLDVLGRAGLFVYSHLHDQLRLAKDYVASLGARSTEAVSMSRHLTRSASRLQFHG